jgi:hypothetical protein
MTEYIVVKGNIIELQERVSLRLREGWVCVGGICVSDSVSFCYQAMAR